MTDSRANNLAYQLTLPVLINIQVWHRGGRVQVGTERKGHRLRHRLFPLVVTSLRTRQALHIELSFPNTGQGGKGVVLGMATAGRHASTTP